MNNIKSLRKALGLTQAALAEMVGVKQPHIVRIEKGDLGVTLKVYADIADALRVPLHALFLDDLSQIEAGLIRGFRALPPDRQKGWADALSLAEGHADQA